MKPVFLIFGDCQALELYRAAGRISYITERYDIHMIERVWRASDEVALPSADIRDRCTLFWRQVNHQSFGEQPLDTLSPARTITFAPIYFSGLWPYFQEDSLFGPEPEAGFPHGFLTYQDRFLAQVAQSRVPAAEAPKIYGDLIRHPESAIEHALEGGLQLMAKWEASTMVPITAYVFSHFRSTRLFWTSGHPSAELMGVVLDRLLGATWPDEFRRRGPRFGAGLNACRQHDSLAYDHWIVAPSIAKALGLEWWRPTEKYLQRPDRWLTVDDYVTAYVEERRRRQAVRQR